jgi:DNA gyrase subunit A
MRIKMNALITTQRLDRFAVKAMRAYGKEVIEQRALPDFRDGLKPVQRRILWGAHQMGLRASGGYKKSARLVGDVMGKFHPHGDSSIYEAMVNMANMSQPLLDGQGGYGYLNEKASAMRYTEVKLSKFADACMFSSAHIEVSELTSNYDGSEREPVILPSLVPNLLLNGTAGVAVGVTSGIPPFTAKSVLKLMRRTLDGKNVSPEWLTNNMELNYPYGGTLHDPERIRLFFTTGQSAISILPDYVFDPSENTITITGGGPYVNDGELAEALYKYDVVTSIDNITESNVHLIVHLKGDNLQALVPKLMKAVGDNITLRLNLTERLFANDPRRTVENEVEFMTTTLPEYMQKWLKWRLELETTAQAQIAANLDKRIKQSALLIHAIDHLDVLFKILREKNADVAKRIAQELKVTVEEGEYLRQRTIGSYAHLSAEKLRNSIKADKDAKKTALAIAKTPQGKVLEDAASLLK